MRLKIPPRKNNFFLVFCSPCLSLQILGNNQLDALYHPDPKSFACKRRRSDRCVSAAVVGDEGETRKEFVLEGENSGRKIKHFYSLLMNTGNFIDLVHRYRPGKLA